MTEEREKAVAQAVARERQEALARATEAAGAANFAQQELSARLQASQQQIAILKAQADSALSELDVWRTQAQSTQAELQAAAAARVSHQETARSLGADLQAAKANLDQALLDRDRVQRQLEEKEGHQKQLTKQLTDMRDAHSANAQAAVQQAQSAAAAAEARAQELSADLVTAQHRLAEAQASVSEYEGIVDKFKTQKESLVKGAQARMAEMEKEAEEEKTQIVEQSKALISKLKAELSSLRNQRDEALAKAEQPGRGSGDADEAVKKVMTTVYKSLLSNFASDEKSFDKAFVVDKIKQTIRDVSMAQLNPGPPAEADADNAEGEGEEEEEEGEEEEGEEEEGEEAEDN